jgi:hypothetical protein
LHPRGRRRIGHEARATHHDDAIEAIECDRDASPRVLSKEVSSPDVELDAAFSERGRETSGVSVVTVLKNQNVHD